MIIYKRQPEKSHLKSAGAFFNQLKEAPQSADDKDCSDMDIVESVDTEMGSQLVIGAC